MELLFKIGMRPLGKSRTAEWSRFRCPKCQGESEHRTTRGQALSHCGCLDSLGLEGFLHEVKEMKASLRAPLLATTEASQKTCSVDDLVRDKLKAFEKGPSEDALRAFPKTQE
jgi:hypothetical protein